MSLPASAEHFASAEVRNHAGRMGMWLFLATEILLFAGLFTTYALYRWMYPQAFLEASRHLDVVFGTLNTVVLITSSLTVALAVDRARHGNNRVAALLLGVSLALAVVFLLVKGVEYGHKLEEGALPGRYYRLRGLELPGAPMFFTVYFFTTGLHAFHVLVGMGVLGWAALRALQGRWGPDTYLGMELAGLYWHLVDLVWIFLYPLLYLV